MPIAAHHLEVGACFGDRWVRRCDSDVATTGVFRRALEAILKSSRRQADWEIARYFEQSGPPYDEDRAGGLLRRSLVAKCNACA
jgi:hypothetical protein